MMQKNLSQPRLPERALPSETYTQRALPPVLTTFDLLASNVVVILWLVNTTTAALGGPVGLSYWVIGGLIFFLPSVIATARLGVLFPQDGSLYTWTYRAFAFGARRPTAALFCSFFAGACFWIVGPLALVIGANAFLSFLQGMLPASFSNQWLAAPWQQGVFMIGLVILANIIALQRFRVAQNLINVMFVLDLIALVLICVATVLWLLHGHPSATNFAHLPDWVPTSPTYFLFGLICLGYLGVATPITMVGELSARSDPRVAIPRHLVWGTLIVLVGYLLCTAALSIVRGSALATSSNLNFELITIVDAGLGKFVGNLTVMCLMPFFLLSPVVYHLASSRLLLQGAVDGRLPLNLGRLNRDRVPANALWFQTVVALFILACIYLVLPFFTSLGQPVDLVSRVYNVVLASLTMATVVATLFLYLNLVLLLRKAPHRLTGGRPGAGALLWVCSGVGVISCGFVLVDTLLNSWTPLMSNTNWFLSVGSFLLVLFVLLSILSIVATSEAAWQDLQSDVMEEQPHSPGG